jgi:hypothetical protein
MHNFFDYSDEPYLFYLAEMLSKDFNKGEGQLLYLLVIIMKCQFL